VDAKLAQDKIKTALKQLLKKQNHTYAAVAKVWDCSIPTVKRQLGAEELPLTRLLTLLEWLNISLADLHKLAESSDLKSPKFTAKQTDFLAKNGREFSFLMKLYEDLTPDQIAKKYKLSPQVLERILINLEKYDLIRVGVGGKVKPFYENTPGVDGALARAHMRRIIDRMAQFHKNHISEVLDRRDRGLEVEKGGLTWHSGDLHPSTYPQFLARFRDLMNELSDVSKLADKTYKKTELKTVVANFGFFMVDHDDQNLPLIHNVFDEDLRVEAPSNQ